MSREGKVEGDTNGDGATDLAVKFDDPISFAKGDLVLSVTLFRSGDEWCHHSIFSMASLPPCRALRPTAWKRCPGAAACPGFW